MKEYWCKAWKIAKNKYLEIQFSKWKDWQWIDLSLRWTRKCDHAGLRFSIHIVGFEFDLCVYDCRHWSYEKGKWE